MFWLVWVGCVEDEVVSVVPVTEQVAVAASGLAIGHVIGPGDVAMGSALPVERTDELTVPQYVLGRTVCSPILAGETFRQGRISQGDGVGIEACVPEGSRLFSVGVDSTLGISVGATVDLVDLSGPPEVVEPGVEVLGIDGMTLQVLVPAGPANARLGSATRVAALLRSPLDGIAVSNDSVPEVQVKHAGNRAVAAHRLEAGRPITAADVVGVESSDGMTVDEAIDQVPKEPILAGERVRPERLANFALDPTGAPIDTFVPRGMRTVTVQLEPLGHAVRAGSTLDVFVPGGSFHLQAVQVFATGGDHAALVVDHEQALELLALGATTVRWSLRNAADVQIVSFEEGPLTQ